MAYSSSFMDSDWQPQSAATAPVGIRFWLLFCAFWSCAGWILSIVHLLNPMGYSMAVLVGAVLLAVFYKRVIQRGRTHPRVGNPVRRFRRIVPLTFLILGRCAILAARGFALHLGRAASVPNVFEAAARQMARANSWGGAARHGFGIARRPGRQPLGARGTAAIKMNFLQLVRCPAVPSLLFASTLP
jgi:hypothetical protein